MTGSSDFYLWGLFYNDLRAALIALYHSSYTNLFPRIERFGRLFKLAPVRSPNKHCEHLVGIRFIKVDEGGLTFRFGCKMGACNGPANRLLLTDVLGGVLGGDGFLSKGGREYSEKNDQQNRRTQDFSHLCLLSEWRPVVRLTVPKW